MVSSVDSVSGSALAFGHGFVVRHPCAGAFNFSAALSSAAPFSSAAALSSAAAWPRGGPCSEGRPCSNGSPNPRGGGPSRVGGVAQLIPASEPGGLGTTAAGPRGPPHLKNRRPSPGPAPRKKESRRRRTGRRQQNAVISRVAGPDPGASSTVPAFASRRCRSSPPPRVRPARAPPFGTSHTLGRCLVALNTFTARQPLAFARSPSGRSHASAALRAVPRTRLRRAVPGTPCPQRDPSHSPPSGAAGLSAVPGVRPPQPGPLAFARLSAVPDGRRPQRRSLAFAAVGLAP